MPRFNGLCAPANGSPSVVVMGVSGSGKTTVARGIATELGWAFVDGDGLHPEANVRRMAAGVALTDADRWPWLELVGEQLRMRTGPLVVACSALKRAYRDAIRAHAPETTFIDLVVPRGVLLERLKRRSGHFMPASLLGSQLAAEEPLSSDESGVTIVATGPPQQTIALAIAWLRDGALPG